MYRIFFRSVFHGIHSRAPWLNLIQKRAQRKKSLGTPDKDFFIITPHF